jgi:DNA repair exonuclease SbcCD ATPase subunit
MTGVDCAKLLEQLTALVGRAGALLLEVDEERQRRSVEAESLRGASAAAWQQAGTDISRQWDDFHRMSEAIQSWSSRYQARPRERAQLSRELVDAGAAQAAGDLLAEIESTAETVASIWTLRDLTLPRLADIGERLEAAEEQVRASGGRVPNGAASAGDDLARLRAGAASDPLSVPAEAVSELAARVQTVCAEMAAEADRLDGVTAQLDGLEAQAQSVTTQLEQARVEWREAQRKIAGSTAAGAPIDALLESVARLRAELAAARHSEDRRTMVAAVSRLEGAFSRVQAEAATAARQATAGLEQRRELRGRLDAYRAKAVASGRVEDLELERLFEAATDALYTAPCDLDEAERRVSAYQRRMQLPAGRTHR